MFNRIYERHKLLISSRYTQIVICICVICLALLTLPAHPINSNANAQIPPDGRVPKHVKYIAMFRHMIDLNKKADAMEKDGIDGAALRHYYKGIAKLNDGQDSILQATAVDCVEQIKLPEAKAKAIVQSVRARYPGGILKPGEKPPEAPAELKQLQKERDNLILEAINSLRKKFGEEEFERFDKFVETHMGGDKSVLPPGIKFPPGTKLPREGEPPQRDRKPVLSTPRTAPK
jgi:hypothetical protein